MVAWVECIWLLFCQYRRQVFVRGTLPLSLEGVLVASLHGLVAASKLPFDAFYRNIRGSRR